MTANPRSPSTALVSSFRKGLYSDAINTCLVVSMMGLLPGSSRNRWRLNVAPSSQAFFKPEVVSLYKTPLGNQHLHHFSQPRSNHIDKAV